MFDRLIASHSRRHRRRVFALGALSAVLHALVILAAVHATSHAGPAPETLRFDTALVFLTAPAQPKPPNPPDVQITSVSQLQGFQTVVAPATIPTEIPPVNLQERFDPRDYSGIGVEGGTGTGVLAAGDAGQVYAFDLVTEQPDRIAGAVPVYPPLLRNAGIQGQVVLEAVIDTSGRVEPGSIRTVVSSNALFDAAAITSLRQTLFRPARVNGRAVRVLIRIPFNFVIR